jgi:hypothetical protein
MSVLPREWEKLMSVHLTTVLKICYIKEGKMAPHYLLGYIWANLSDEKKEEICDELQRRIDQ